MPRLLVITETLGIGGTESHLIRILPHLAARGWSVAVYCLTDRGDRANELEKLSIPVFGGSQLQQASARPSRKPARLIFAAIRLFRLMRWWRPCVAHFYLPGPYLVGAPIALAIGIPVKIMSRRSQSRYQKKSAAFARLERILHQRMCAVTANSGAVMGELVDEGVPLSKLRLIYNGIDTLSTGPSRTEARRALGIEPGTFVGVMAANLIFYKGHSDLIEGLSRVSAKLPPGWRMLCAGRDDGLMPALQGLCTRRGIADNVDFLGSQKNIPQLLAAADFAILTSWEEGFSNFILESMLTELPVIATSVGGNPEAVLDGYTGLLVPPRDPSAVGEAILRLALDPDLRRRLGHAGLDRVRQEFSIEACVDAHDKLYKELLTRNGCGYSHNESTNATP